MNTQTEDLEPAPPRKRMAPRGVKLALVLIGGFFLVFILLRPWNSEPKQALVWLTPTQFASATIPGPFTRFKYKVMNITAPIWRHFQRPKRQILIDANFVAVSAAAPAEPKLGNPIATNSDGTLAWILSPSDLTSFRKLLRDISEAQQLGGPRITIGDGMQGGIFQGNSLPVFGKIGMGVDVTARIVSQDIRLLVKAISTDPVESPPGNVVSVKTNVSAFCRVVVPNAGGLVLLAGNPNEPTTTNQWLILSASEVNSGGQPLTPRAVIRRKM